MVSFVPLPPHMIFTPETLLLILEITAKTRRRKNMLYLNMLELFIKVFDLWGHMSRNHLFFADA